MPVAVAVRPDLIADDPAQIMRDGAVEGGPEPGRRAEDGGAPGLVADLEASAAEPVQALGVPAAAGRGGETLGCG